MKIYKVVPYSASIVLRKDELAQEAVVRYFEVINQEIVDGWELVSIAPVTVTRKLGGLKSRDENYSAFIFAKESVND
ncbi:MAG: hypothetical protein ACI4M6_03345 [Christensenellaceae bacterium]